MRAIRTAGVAAVTALAIAGCGDSKRAETNITNAAPGTTPAKTPPATSAPTATTEVPPVGPPVATIKLDETDFKLNPANPKVDKTGIVLIEASNTGKATHAIEVEGPDGEKSTGPIAPGGKSTLKVNLDKPGPYVWYCPIADHRARGMEGHITVGG
jgi:plastocyanin